MPRVDVTLRVVVVRAQRPNKSLVAGQLQQLVGPPRDRWQAGPRRRAGRCRGGHLPGPGAHVAAHHDELSVPARWKHGQRVAPALCPRGHRPLLPRVAVCTPADTAVPFWRHCLQLRRARLIRGDRVWRVRSDRRAHRLRQWRRLALAHLHHTLRHVQDDATGGGCGGVQPADQEDQI